MAGNKPFFAQRPYENPETVPEIAGNDIVDIHNAVVRGEIDAIEASRQMSEVEKMLIEVGDGWFDRYGPPPPELDHLFEGEDRYWERDDRGHDQG